MKRLIKLLSKYPVAAVLAPLFKLIEAGLDLLVPVVMAMIIDNGIAASDREYVLKMGGCLIMLGVLGLLFSITAQYLAAKASVNAVSDLRDTLYRHIQKLDYASIDKIGVSGLINRMTGDINQVQNGINMTLRLLLRSPIVVIGSMIMAFTIDVKGGALFAIIIPVLAILVFGFMRYTKPMHKAVSANADVIIKKTREYLNGVRVIRAFDRDGVETKDYHEASDRLYNSQMKVSGISSFMNPITLVIVNLGVVAILYYGGIEVSYGLLSGGQVIALVNYMSEIMVELVKMANFIVLLTKATAASDRIYEVIDTKPSDWIIDDAEKSSFYIEFKGVSFQYDDAADKSLSNISFTVNEGDIVGIIGGTGSGKSTLGCLLAGFYPATEGTVFIGGRNIRTISKEELRKPFSIAHQKPALFAGTVRENMLLANPRATQEEMTEALSTACANDFLLEKNGLDTTVQQGGKNFSGGQRARLALAVALIKPSGVLILDDVCAALDFLTEKRLMENLKQYAKDKTVFIISQRVSSIIRSDKIIVLDDGEAIGIDTHENLLCSCPEYRYIYDSQYSED